MQNYAVWKSDFVSVNTIMYHKSDEQSLKITPQAATSHEKKDLTEVF